MGSKLKYVLLVLLVLIILIGVTLSFIVPVFTKNYIVDTIEEGCGKCKITISTMYLSPFNLKLVKLSNVNFEYYDKDILEIEANVNSIQVKVEDFDWNQKKLLIESVHIGSPKVSLTETKKKAPDRSSKSDNESNKFEVVIKQINLDNGSFSYNYRKEPKTATLEINKINVEIDAFGNTEELKDKMVTASAQALLENSGEVNLTVSTYLFKSPIYVDVNAKVNNQNLGAVTPFFKNYDGVILNGRLIEGISSIAMRGQNIRATVMAEYKDLDVKVEDTSERSGAAAFFTQLFAEIAMKEKNLEKPKIRQIRAVEIERESDESIVSFILRGMKDAAIAVAKAK